MKLTKGKISKLYRKNKQSLKRYKKKETNKNKSFRKRGHVNLRNKSLKNYKGGQDKEDALNEKKPVGSPNIQDGKNKTAELLSEASDELNDGNNAVDPETLKQEQETISQVSPELGESPKKESLDIDSYPSDLTQEPLPEPSAQLETASSNNQNESTALLEKEASTEISPEQTESTQKVLEEIPEVTDSQAAASPFLAEVKTEKEEGVPEQTSTAQTTEETAPQVSEETGAQTDEETGLQTNEETAPQVSEETGLQTTEETARQTDEETTPQVSEKTGAQISDETGAQTSEDTGPQTSAPEQSAPSTEGLPENVSVAAKTILDYAMGSLAKQINSSTISQGVQNPESAFTNMTNTFASQGGRSKKSKLKVKGKKTRKH